MSSKVVTPAEFRRARRQLCGRILGQHIERCRRRARKSVLEAAEMAGIGPEVWDQAESGNSPLTLNQLDAVRRVLEVSEAEMGPIIRRCSHVWTE